MKSNNKKTGQRGEDLAVEFLHNKGFLIVERNFRTRYGELDIVCYYNNILVFVEVKTKIGHDFGEPEEMINKKKLGQVERMGEVYIELKTQELKNSKTQNNDGLCKWSGGCRVDVVAVVLDRDLELESIKHYEAVY